ncbi:MAG: transcription antitermination factor NusB [Alphaproteobacteria bacterium]|jgi:N utilization substance protein B|nr:transcription antitermination factor NusB [Alphaproteobacteria bacterium]
MATHSKNDEIKPKKKVDILSRFRTLARLASVQALYQIEFMKTGPIIVINQYLRDGICLEEEKMIAIKETKLFKAIVEGVFARIQEIDQMIDAAIEGDVSASRFEPIMRNIMRAGIFELMAHADVPSPVIINEYLDITHLFYQETEPKIVNGILNKMSVVLRQS